MPGSGSSCTVVSRAVKALKKWPFGIAPAKAEQALARRLFRTDSWERSVRLALELRQSLQSVNGVREREQRLCQRARGAQYHIIDYFQRRVAWVGVAQRVM